MKNLIVFGLNYQQLLSKFILVINFFIGNLKSGAHADDVLKIYSERKTNVN